MNTKVFIIILFSLMAFYNQGQGQNAPITFGKVSEEEIAMTECEYDKDAAAVVLTDYGSARMSFSTGEATIITFRHKRIKIFKKAGFDQADIVLTYYSKNGAQDIDRLEAQTINVENGKTEIIKIGKKEIFKEKIDDDYTRIKFTLPKIKEGSIIEYKYQFVKEGIFSLRPWYFQEEIPTLWSEFKFKIPNIVEYVIMMNQSKPFDIDSKEPTLVNMGEMGNNEKGTIYRFVMKDMEAMIEESYLTTMKDYRSSVEFQLSAVTRGYARETILSTWEKMGEDLLDDNDNCGQLEVKPRLKNIAEFANNAVAGQNTEEEKLKAVYNAITKKIKWNDNLGYFVENLNDVFERGTGSAAEINLCLIAALREVGLQADPVLASTRGHGKLQTLYPIFRQFNHLFAQVSVDGKKILVDATDAKRPFYLLPSFDLNKSAMVVKKVPEWVEIEPKKSTTRETVILKLGEDGSWNGQMKGIYKNYSAYHHREEFDEEGKEAYSEGIFEEESDFSVMNLEVENMEEVEKPLVVNVEFSGEFGDDDMVYMNPVIFSSFEESPFKLEERNYPIDFAYPFSNTYVMNLEIPEGYAVEESPEPVAYELSGKRGMFHFDVKNQGEFIQLMSKISVNSAIFQPEDYKELKLFFEKIVEKQAEQIVLKKA